MGSQDVIGVMSGTSLDGLDIAFCSFVYDRNWRFEIKQAETIPYSENWKHRLRNAPALSGIDLYKLHNDFGKYIGAAVKHFINKHQIKAHLIASHGHTVFHQPENKLTLQIGNGAEIAAETGITSISDFRSFDVALGGQGAPLVPIGDELLFSEYDYCINIGGFANISFKEKKQRLAYDISPANIILNQLAQQLGHAYDENGHLGRSGKLNHQLIKQLNDLPYYRQNFPKSLGKEWLDQHFIPVLNDSNLSIPDQLTTIYHHIADQISKSITKTNSKVLISGGGAYNQYLIELIKQRSKSTIEIPNKTIIDFKEALIFAFLGTLRYQNQINCLCSVTGAKRDSCGGIIHEVS